MAHRYSVEQANRSLPLVRRIVADILTHGQRLRSVGESPEQPIDLDCMERLNDEVARLVLELESLGCFYKGWDFQVALVDFPAVIDGREVLLCWRSDETAVTWYHDYEQGYAGRRPIPAALLKPLRATEREH